MEFKSKSKYYLVEFKSVRANDCWPCLSETVVEVLSTLLYNLEGHFFLEGGGGGGGGGGLCSLQNFEMFPGNFLSNIVPRMHNIGCRVH